MRKFIAVLILGLMLAGCDEKKISGTVVDQLGNPIQQAKINITSADNQHKSEMVTDNSGSFSVNVPSKFSGFMQIVPAAGFAAVVPSSRTLTNVTSNLTGQDFVATVVMLTISGKICSGESGSGEAGVVVTATGSYSGGTYNTTASTDENGQYSIEVPYGWSGNVAPEKAGMSFAATQCAN